MNLLNDTRCDVDASGLRVAFYVPTLVGGGAEKSILSLAEAFARRGYRVDLLLNRRTGAYADCVPAGVEVVELARYSKTRARLAVLQAYPFDVRAVFRPVLVARRPIMALRYLPGLVDYLSRARPNFLISAMFYANLLAIWARRLARVDTRLIVTEHNTLSRQIVEGQARRSERSRWQYLPALLGSMYPRADAIVAVSNGVADDLAATARLARDGVGTIYNPVVFSGLGDLAAESLIHPWFEPGAPPVILSAGRLEAQKDFSTLIEAFASVRQRRHVRLMILGDGSLRGALQHQAETLGVAADVELHGWVDNPYAYMSRAGLFVLSSVWEGLGNVLIEALACGCPVVATDCPNGPREILCGQQYGALVATGDVPALARAITDKLDASRPAELLRERASAFSIARSVEQYRALMDSAGRAPNDLSVAEQTAQNLRIGSQLRPELLFTDAASIRVGDGRIGNGVT